MKEFNFALAQAPRTSTVRVLVVAVTASCLLAACEEDAPDDADVVSSRSDATTRVLAEARYRDTSYEDAHGTEECTEDCSGHDAGYAWARDHDITDEDDCGGNSESFIEGCKAWVRDNT